MAIGTRFPEEEKLEWGHLSEGELWLKEEELVEEELRVESSGLGSDFVALNCTISI